MQIELCNIGNSVGILLPREILESLQLKAGDKIALVPNDKGYQLSVEKLDFDYQMRRARELMARYRGTLRELFSK